MPSLIVPIIGDSNSCFSGVRIAADNVTDSAIWMLDRASLATTPAIMLATEVLLEDSSRGNLVGTATPNTLIGSTLALIKLLVARGKVPSGYDKVVIVGTGWSGTAMVNQWAVTGTRLCLDGGAGELGFFTMVQAALALDSANRIWFFDQAGFGANCSGDAIFQSEQVAMWAEMRSTLRTGLSAPVLITPPPPDRAAVALGGATGLVTITSILANCANWLPNSYYCDAVGLPSEMGNTQPFIHYSAASQRGGVDNSTTTTSLYSSGSWIWSSSVTYAAGNHVLGSDNVCYNSVGNGNINHNPVGDGGVNWTPTSYQYGRTITDPLSERKYRAIVNNPAFYQFAGSW